MKRNIIISVFISLAIGLAVGIYDVFNPIVLDECGDWAQSAAALRPKSQRIACKYPL